jgi:hypothetical protein
MKSVWTMRIIIIGLIAGPFFWLADAGSDTITVDSYVKPSVEVSITQEECVWELSPKLPGTYSKNSHLQIRSNTPWIITVQEENGSDGHMMEWNGNNYGNRKLSIPMIIKADRSVTLPNLKGSTIKSGLRTGSTPRDVDFSFVQQVTEEDAIDGGNKYRMVVTFTGSPAT